MPQNQVRAPLLAKGFPMVQSMRPGDARSRRSHHNIQTNKHPILIVGYCVINKLSIAHTIELITFTFENFPSLTPSAH